MASVAVLASLPSTMSCTGAVAAGGERPGEFAGNDQAGQGLAGVDGRGPPRGKLSDVAPQPRNSASR